ncbi:hypothetical protein EYC95_00530 [Pseudomonas sp. BGI-2]|nr:hypothetical protein EYC95_00530 [Pseudomonas sp. BGI-2]
MYLRSDAALPPYSHARQTHHTIFRKLSFVPHQQDSGIAVTKPVIKRFNLRLETRTRSVSLPDCDLELKVQMTEGEL